MKKKTAKTRTARKKTVRKPRKKKGLAARLSESLNTKYGSLGFLMEEAKENIRKSFETCHKVPVPDTPLKCREIPPLYPSIKIGPDDEIVMVTANGNHVKTTFRDIYQDMEELQRIKDENPIPDIPNYANTAKKVYEADRTVGNYAQAASKEEDLKQRKTPVTEAFDIFEKRTESVNRMMEIQGSDGNWNASEYMFGMYNGMELVASIYQGREVMYRNKPDFKNKKTEDHSQAMNGVKKSPAELIKEFLASCHDFPEMIPVILQDVNSILLNRVREEAEKAGEISANARKRFDDCCQIMNKLANN